MQNNTVSAISDRGDRPAYVRFDRIPVEDKAATLKAGQYVGKDVDYAILTPAYTKDEVYKTIPVWFETMDQQLRDQRIPQEWVANYKAQYEAWKNGQELPLNGTPIKGWGVISPAQQETLIRMRVLTVEDLAAMNDEGVHRIGMGALDIKNKARAWLAQLQDKGPLTIKMASLEQENVNLKSELSGLAEKYEQLSALVKAHVPGVSRETLPTVEEISAADILDVPQSKNPPLGLPKKK